MTDPAIWKLEEDLWTGGTARFREALDDACLMAFPAPVGILAGRQPILDSLEGAPRWASVTMTERKIAQPADGIIVLAYRAEGHRESDAVYRVYCSSTYHRDADRWRLVQHQQTPI